MSYHKYECYAWRFGFVAVSVMSMSFVYGLYEQNRPKSLRLADYAVAAPAPAPAPAPAAQAVVEGGERQDTVSAQESYYCQQGNGGIWYASNPKYDFDCQLAHAKRGKVDPKEFSGRK